jgi:hypothetical protein
MAQDPIRAALRLLVKADRDALRVVRLIARLLADPGKVPTLANCTFKAGTKTYKGRLTHAQCARLKAGGSVVKVQKLLLKLLGKVDRAQADSLARIKAALTLKTAVHAGGTTPPLGACDYTNAANQPDCADNLTQTQCTAINGITFRLGQTCGKIPPERK